MQLWEIGTGQPVGGLMMAGERVYDAMFTPDSKRMVIGTIGGFMRVWDVATNQPITQPVRHGGATFGVYLEAVSPDGRHRGAYQFKRSTWNTVANNVGRDDLIGVDPAAAPAVDQDWMALYLYKWQGASHWEGRCAGK